MIKKSKPNMKEDKLQGKIKTKALTKRNEDKDLCKRITNQSKISTLRSYVQTIGPTLTFKNRPHHSFIPMKELITRYPPKKQVSLNSFLDKLSYSEENTVNS